MVDAVRNTEQAWQVNYTRTEKENASKVFRRSLYVVADTCKPGDVFH